MGPGDQRHGATSPVPSSHPQHRVEPGIERRKQSGEGIDAGGDSAGLVLSVRVGGFRSEPKSHVAYGKPLTRAKASQHEGNQSRTTRRRGSSASPTRTPSHGSSHSARSSDERGHTGQLGRQHTGCDRGRNATESNVAGLLRAQLIPADLGWIDLEEFDGHLLTNGEARYSADEGAALRRLASRDCTLASSARSVRSFTREFGRCRGSV